MSLPEIAFYYPGPYWRSADWVKNLLVFFDGVGLLVPSYMRNQDDHVLEPHLAEPLKAQGLLHILEPETVVDAETTQRLHEAVVNILESGKLEPLLKSSGSAFHEISYSRMGGFGEPRLANDLLERLKARGLAKDTEDGVSIPMHSAFKEIFLALLSQLLRPQGRKQGLDLSPATDRPSLVEALSELVQRSTPTSVDVVASDLETVGVDLASVPLDEVLGFRKEHFAQYRAYARSVRIFVRDLSLMNPEQRCQAEEDRRGEITDLANDLKKQSRRTWRRPASVGLSAAGAAWTLITGDPVGAVLGGGAALLGTGGDKGETGVFSYLFRARNQMYA